MGIEMRLAGFTETSQLQARARRGALPEKAALYAPHSNEHPAALPFQHRLKDSLQKRGVEVETRAPTGMMGKLWRIRKSLDRSYERDIFQAGLLTSIFTIQDMYMRLKMISDYLRRNPEGAVMEIHAADESILANAPLLSQRDLREFLIVSGTNALICRDALSSFSGALSDASGREGNIQNDIPIYISSMEMQEESRETLARIKKEVEQMCNFSTEDSLREARELVSLLSPHRKRIMLIEIPSKRADLAASHPLYPLYFTGDGALLRTSCFEEAYASCTRQSIGFSENDVQAALSQLKVC